MRRLVCSVFAALLLISSAEAKKLRVYTPKGSAPHASVARPEPAPSAKPMQVVPIAPAAAEPVREASGEEVRSLIFMIGDGMGLSHVAAMMIEGGYAPTAFDRMENVALIATRSANNLVTDSAAAGTALATGSKTDNGRLGEAPDGHALESMIAKAWKREMPTGVVVTCKIQHATPGAFYAHVPNRNLYDEISRQLASSKLDVAFGGGKAEMTAPDASGRSAADELVRTGCRVIYDWNQAEDIRSGRVAGFFADDHLPSMLDGRGDYLPQATRKALEILDNNAREAGKGFVLMVEGSQIDFESHGNNAAGVLAEVRDFEAAVSAAMRFVDNHPGTLLVVTADHETGGLSMPSRKADFTASESGMDYKFGSGSHTGILVPVYLYGAGAERINGVMDNTELSRKLMALLDLK